MSYSKAKAKAEAVAKEPYDAEAVPMLAEALIALIIAVQSDMADLKKQIQQLEQAARLRG